MDLALIECNTITIIKKKLEKINSKYVLNIYDV